MKHPFLLAAVTAGLALSSPFAGAGDDDDDDEIPFAEARLFFELNDTDGDLGIHAKIDGDEWRRLKIEDVRERRMLNIAVTGRLARQGLTEIFFESAEPPFDELDPVTFFRRFPEGVYEIEGRRLDGAEMESEVLLTHVMPAPAGGITLNGTPDEVARERCDDEDPAYDPTVVTTKDGAVQITWAPVTHSHPDADGAGAGVQPPVPVTIANYEVVVEATVELDGGEEFESLFSVILPPSSRSVTIPANFVGSADEFKYEILARETSDNQTAVESCFVLD